MDTDTLNMDEVRLMNAQCVAEAIRMNQPLILLDSRPSTEFNVSHISKAINVGGDFSFRRKFSQNSVVPMEKLLPRLLGAPDLSSWQPVPIVVYDRNLDNLDRLDPDCFLYKLLLQLLRRFVSIYILKGGFLGFQAEFPKLCWFNQDQASEEDAFMQSDTSPCGLERLLDECLNETTQSSFSTVVPQSEIYPPTATTWLRSETDLQFSLKGACSSDSSPRTHCHEFLPEVPPNPSSILPYLTIGSQADALNLQVYERHKITHVLNVSVDCPTSPHVPPERFMRIAIRDNHKALILPHLHEAFKFIDDAESNKGHVLVHCAAGISRSPTLVIAYLMHSQHMRMSKAYDFVRSKRSSIAPNFNFLGQLLELDGQLFPSTSPAHCLGSGESTLTDQSKPTDRSRGQRVSSESSRKPPTGAPSPIPCSTPKHVGTKKRERPNHLSLDVSMRGESSYPSGGTQSYQPSPIGGLTAGSPSEGKRSRVSLLNPSFPLTSTGISLRSPCTAISSLQLSSPMDPHRGFTQAFITQSSLDNLHYVPCSIGSASTSLRRSFASFGMTVTSPGSIRPTLLFERPVSNQQSAPSTPSRLNVEQVRQNKGQQHQLSQELDLSSPISTSTSRTSSVPFTRDFSPIADRSTKPGIERDDLQQSAFVCSSNSSSVCIAFKPRCLSELPNCLHHHDQTTDSLISHKLRFSQSAPTDSFSSYWNAFREINRTPNSSPLESPFPFTCQSSLSRVSASVSHLTRMRASALGLELSCRQEETLWQCTIDDVNFPFLP